MQTQKHYKYLKSNQALLEDLAMKTDTHRCVTITTAYNITEDSLAIKSFAY